VGIGDQVLDLKQCAEAGLFDPVLAPVLRQRTLCGVMELDVDRRIQLRHRISELLESGNHEILEGPGRSVLIDRAQVELRLPVEVRDYTDFYASVFHATNVGSMFRPDNPLLPNYKHVPIGYHGRASSLIPSGQAFRRPVGQLGPATDDGRPTREPCKLLDYELEVGFYVGPGNALGTTIPVERAEDHIFGLSLVNDWSARDIQRWEYQPLGPFLAKSFATTVSPWVVTLEALAPFRCPVYERPPGDPLPLDYLMHPSNQQHGGFDLHLTVSLSSAMMRGKGIGPLELSRGTFRDMYWTLAQMLTHHSSNGCNMQTGDLLASGTVSNQERSSRGCLLELTWDGDARHPLPGTQRTPIELPTGEQRKFLADGDEVLLQAYCQNDSRRRIGFGECRGIVLPAAV
jgi:fumarylacetoacetase